MTTSALKAFGKVLRWNSQLVAEVTKITYSGSKSTAVIVTSEDSSAGWQEKIGGLKDAGTISLEFNFIPGDTVGQIAMAADFANQVVRTATITFPPASATVLTVSGFLSDFKLVDGGLDGELKGAATITITGAPSIAITASSNISALVYTDSVGAKTSLPVFAAATHGPYTVTINTASGYIMLTVTHTGTIAAQATIAGVAGPVWYLTSTVISGQIVVGAAATTTLLTITVTDTGKVPVTYTVYIVRP